jgi:hypothetical protein
MPATAGTPAAATTDTDDDMEEGHVEEDSFIELAACLHFTRLCKRLHGGGSPSNARRMAHALGVPSHGGDAALRTRVERRLRQVSV